MRVVYDGVDDLRRLMPDLSDAAVAETDFGSYTESQFFDDMARVTEYRADPDLVAQLVTRSYETLEWMGSKGVRFMPIYGRQAFKVGGRFKFWGGLTVETVGGGPGLVESLTAACARAGIPILYEHRAVSLVRDGDRVEGVRARHHGATRELGARAVVLASGGFEANNEWRAR